jgi:nucleoid-associated protein YgaU
MNKSKLLAFLILVISAALVFAQANNEGVPSSVLNNPDYLESVRLKEKAQEAYEAGDYDTSADYAKQAAEYARRSDAYVAMRLAENALFKASSRYSWARSVNAATRFSEAFQTATEALNQAQDAHAAKDWDTTTDASNRVLAALAVVTGPGAPAISVPPGGLPAQFTVRDWKTTGDCLWNIAAKVGIYGDSYQWRKLYEANKEKLPDPKNPNWVEPGTVLDIPSIKGETRSGMWDPSAKY